MVYEFRFPDVGEGIHEGEIVNWLVSQGDEVEADEDIVEVMTDKATVQISAPVAGTIQEIRYQDGEVVQVGEIFVLIAEAGTASESGRSEAPGQIVSDGDDAGASEAAAPSEPASEETADAGEDEAAEAAEAEAEVEATGTAKPAAEASPKPATNGTPTRTPASVLAPPSVRIEARKQGIDLTTIQGSGPAGRIHMDDLAATPSPGQAARSSPSPASSSDILASPSIDRSQALQVEAIQAPASSPMASSKRAKTLQPHFTYALTVNASKLARASQAAGRSVEGAGLSIGPGTFVVKAIAEALSKHARLNALVDEGSRDMVIFGDVHISVAQPTEDGLALTTVPDVRSKGLQEIAGYLAGQETSDATPTITVTLLEEIGGLVSTPVLVHPQLTSVVVGAMREVGQLDDGEIVAGHELTLSFAFDHRLIDGYDGALFANDVARLLAEPGALQLDDSEL